MQAEDMIAKLELDYELQKKITEAALKLAKDPTVAKSVRKKRKASYHKSSQKVWKDTYFCRTFLLLTLNYYGLGCFRIHERSSDDTS